jgi:hypothetical protein
VNERESILTRAGGIDTVGGIDRDGIIHDGSDSKGG